MELKPSPAQKCAGVFCRPAFENLQRTRIEFVGMEVSHRRPGALTEPLKHSLDRPTRQQAEISAAGGGKIPVRPAQSGQWQLHNAGPAGQLVNAGTKSVNTVAAMAHGKNAGVVAETEFCKDIECPQRITANGKLGSAVADDFFADHV